MKNYGIKLIWLDKKKKLIKKLWIMKSIEKLKLAINASLKAAIEINKIYQSENFNIKFKKDNSPLTKADLASNDIIKSELNKSNIPILSEEGKMTDFAIRKKWNELWIVDPIDGTKEFIKRNGEFTVNIALLKKNPIIGLFMHLSSKHFTIHQTK